MAVNRLRLVCCTGAVIAATACRAAVPPLYGAAQLREDTATGSLAVVYADSTHLTPGWPLSVRLQPLTMNVRNVLFSVRSGVGGARTGVPLPLYMQDASVTLLTHCSWLQAVFGYQPMRVREVTATDAFLETDYSYPEFQHFKVYNRDRFRAGISGMCTLSPRRHFLFGVEVIADRLRGATLLRTYDYTTSFEYVEYQRFEKGDGTVGVRAGGGYWRDFDFRESPYKMFFTVDVSLSTEHEGGRYNEAIEPVLLANAYGNGKYQYAIRTTGTRQYGGFGELRLELSRRFVTLFPLQSNSITAPVHFFGSVEGVSFGTKIGRISEYSIISEKSNVFPDAVNYFNYTHAFWLPEADARHIFRIGMTPEMFVNRAALITTVVYHSRLSGRLRARGRGPFAAWNNTTDVWTGIALNWRNRLELEAAWKCIYLSAGFRYVSRSDPFGTGTTGAFSLAKDNELMLRVRLLW
ncbi:MAG: hypothetical protein JW863_14845 [Chitinispirillaceae bacterium]|nr:hypothetical protein [Chitinispirillaceae bacterium]